MNQILTRILVAGVFTMSVLAPAFALGAPGSPPAGQYSRRQETKNEWRNIAIGAGILGVIGLLNDDPTLTFVGAAGALYAAWRYEEDRKSQNAMRRARALYFSKPYFYRNGVRYERRTVWKKGTKYYQFCKVKSKKR